MASAAVASNTSSSPTNPIHLSAVSAEAMSSSNNNKNPSPTSTMITTTTTTTTEPSSRLPEDASSSSPMYAHHHHSVEQQNEMSAKEAPGTAAAADDHDTKPPAAGSDGGPLPRDLKRILLEVAKTGSCPWLPWEQIESNAEQHHGSKEIDHEASAATAASSDAEKISSVPPTAGNNSSNHPQPAHVATLQQSEKVKKSSAAAAGPPPKQSLFVAARRGPPRKKHRNGVHNKNASSSSPSPGVGAAAGASSRMRFGNLDGATSSTRKRPLVVMRNNAAPGSVHSSAPSSVGTGSEPDDSTQYECDSEGTSATTNSEVSVERLRKTHHQLAAAHLAGGLLTLSKSSADQIPVAGRWDTGGLSYNTLQAAFRTALGLVLDHFYHTRGGYKLSPAERRRNDTLGAETEAFANATNEGVGNSDDPNKKLTPLSPEDIYLQRREKLMTMLLPGSLHPKEDSSGHKHNEESFNPPFTIQRVSEVLIAPERYYTQTHKLCNCLEKLLLVTSSTAAFGGITGGDTSQSRREERELAALADEKGKQESALRQKRLQRRTSSPTDELLSTDGGNNTLRNGEDGSPDRGTKGGASFSPEKNSSDNQSKHSDSNSESASREQLEAAARASLRTKFDHVGIDPHNSPNARDVRAIAEDRGMTKSPPPPSLAMSAAASLTGHGGVSGFVMQHHPEHNTEHRGVGRVSSPIMFSHGNDHSHLTEASNRHLLQLHHAVSTAGAPLNQNNLELMNIGTSARTHHSGPGSAENADGRSSTSNSDVDSESDDVSFDDSASDRSDGSDYGSGPHFEASTPARAMALNRIQQQRRLESRALTAASLHQNEGYRPPADTEYQSGDSIDSTKAEDSGGSDSSSSDMAD